MFRELESWGYIVENKTTLEAENEQVNERCSQKDSGYIKKSEKLLAT